MEESESVSRVRDEDRPKTRSGLGQKTCIGTRLEWVARIPIRATRFRHAERDDMRGSDHEFLCNAVTK